MHWSLCLVQCRGSGDFYCPKEGGPRPKEGGGLTQGVPIRKHGGVPMYIGGAHAHGGVPICRKKLPINRRRVLIEHPSFNAAETCVVDEMASCTTVVSH